MSIIATPAGAARRAGLRRLPLVAALVVVTGIATLTGAAASSSPSDEVLRLLDDQNATLTSLYAGGASPAEVHAVIERFEEAAYPLLWDMSPAERATLRERIERDAGRLWDLTPMR